jgi:hypothetical protein
MAWECSYCGEKEKGRNRMAACHHCGRLVCRRHRAAIPDGAFSDGSGSSAARIAVHCAECRSTFHPQTISVEPGEPLAEPAAP